MCGIAGIIDWEAPSTEHATRLHDMQQALSHRGPDGSDAVFSDFVAFAFTHLAIVSDSPRSRQPLERAGHILVFNGEIVDWQDLARTLGITATCDAEVVLEALVTWGEEALPKLNGMFALAWYDRNRQQGLLARDALGVKPLVYATDPLRFASEAHALGGAPDEAVIAEWMALPQLTSTPPFRGVRSLPAGHCLRFDRRGETLVRWFTWAEDPSPIDPESFSDTLTTVFREWGTARLPVASFLSGGLDSTAVTALGHPDYALTIAFSGQSAFQDSAIVREDDAPYAVAVAAELGIPLTTVAPTRSLTALAQVARIDDRLPAWEQQVAQHHLAEAVAGKIVLVGDAADELFHGYDFLLTQPSTDALYTFFGVHRRAALLRRPVLPSLDGDLVTLIRERWLARLLHNGDIHTMAHGVEARVPFADPRILAFAMRSPKPNKESLKEALLGRIPHIALARRKSALQKDQGAEQLYRTGLATLDLSTVDSWLSGDAIRALTARDRWDETDRHIAFQVLALSAWVQHHGHGVSPS